MTLLLGDCLEVMREMPDSSIDAVITDPPYGINFMGKAWDGRAIEAAAQKDRETRKSLGPQTPMRLTGGAESPNRKWRERRASGFGNAAGVAGAYDFSAKGNRAFQQWCEMWGSECLRILKPGGHLLSFGGTRTYHRLACGLEDAGFEIRDCLSWMFGSGFPKSLDVSKAIARAEGAERERNVVPDKRSTLHGDRPWMNDPEHRFESNEPVTAAAAAAAAAGWGTALKPAYEPIVVARKPFAGTVAANYQEHKTGALNIDATRIRFASAGDQAAAAAAMRASADQNAGRTAYGRFENGPASIAPYLAGMDKGRWPANVLLDGEAAEILDAQSGASASTVGKPREGASGNGWGMTSTGAEYDDSGGASRFFYCAKVSRSERNAGTEHMPRTRRAPLAGALNGETGADVDPLSQRFLSAPVANNHPTVKPLDLMRWLIRLVTPPGGHILDPFGGSGSTGCAAELEHVHYTLIEREPDYMRIIEARTAFWREHGDDGLRICSERDAAERVHDERAKLGQLNILDALA